MISVAEVVVLPGGATGPAGPAPYIVGPFVLADVPAGSDPDPAEAMPSPAGYGSGGEAATSWVAPRAGSITAITVGLSASAAGSNLHATLLVGEEGFASDHTAIVEQPGRTVRVAIPEGAVPVAEGEEVLIAVQTGSGWFATMAFTACIEFTPS